MFGNFDFRGLLKGWPPCPEFSQTGFMNQSKTCTSPWYPHQEGRYRDGKKRISQQQPGVDLEFGQGLWNHIEWKWLNTWERTFPLRTSLLGRLLNYVQWSRCEQDREPLNSWVQLYQCPSFIRRNRNQLMSFLVAKGPSTSSDKCYLSRSIRDFFVGLKCEILHIVDSLMEKREESKYWKIAIRRKWAHYVYSYGSFFNMSGKEKHKSVVYIPPIQFDPSSLALCLNKCLLDIGMCGSSYLWQYIGLQTLHAEAFPSHALFRRYKRLSKFENPQWDKILVQQTVDIHIFLHDFQGNC